MYLELDIYYDPERIGSEFNSVASKRVRLFSKEICLYDLLMGFWERSANEAMIKFIAVSGKQGDILELGTGTGHLLSLLAENFSQSKIASVDYSEKMIEVAKQYLLKNNPQTHIISDCQHYVPSKCKEFYVKFIHHNCFNLPKKQKYDLIVSSFLFDIQTPSKLNELLAECACLIKNEGSIFIAVLDDAICHSHVKWFSRNYFLFTNSIYKFCYRSDLLRRISQQFFSGYYTHCRPVNIEQYIANIPDLKIFRKTVSSIKILGIPFLPVAIVEVVKA